MQPAKGTTTIHEKESWDCAALADGEGGLLFPHVLLTVRWKSAIIVGLKAYQKGRNCLFTGRTGYERDVHGRAGAAGRPVRVFGWERQPLPRSGGGLPPAGRGGLHPLPRKPALEAGGRRPLLYHPQRHRGAGLADAPRQAGRLARDGQPRRLAHLAAQGGRHRRGRLSQGRDRGLRRDDRLHLAGPAPERGRPAAGQDRRRRRDPAGRPRPGAALHPQSLPGRPTPARPGTTRWTCSPSAGWTAAPG